MKLLALPFVYLKHSCRTQIPLANNFPGPTYVQREGYSHCLRRQKLKWIDLGFSRRSASLQRGRMWFGIRLLTSDPFPSFIKPRE